MKIRRVISDRVGEPPPQTWSNCLVCGDQVFIAGMTARGATFDDIAADDAYGQARIIFAKIGHLMEQAGGRMADVVKVTIYVTDIGDREAVWRARREVFSGDFPVSTLIEVSALAHPDMRVEVEATGFLGAGGG
jgi:2-iminobutanoate/2-iminopropanoate deaminase